MLILLSFLFFQICRPDKIDTSPIYVSFSNDGAHSCSVSVSEHPACDMQLTRDICYFPVPTRATHYLQYQGQNFGNILFDSFNVKKLDNMLEIDISFASGGGCSGSGAIEITDYEECVPQPICCRTSNWLYGGNLLIGKNSDCYVAPATTDSASNGSNVYYSRTFECVISIFLIFVLL